MLFNKNLLLIAGLSLILTACETVELYPKTSSTYFAPNYQLIDSNLQSSQSDDTESSFVIKLASTRPGFDFTDELQVKEQTIYAHPNLYITRNDLENVTAKANKKSGKAWVVLTLNDAGARKLESITRDYQGKYLVVSSKNQIVSLLKINSIASDELDIPMSNAFQASALQEQILDGE
ncbi:SecDF P1 head subdomain-containing protein [Basilea psittacipulmonis]|uniref:SecDF P1 head subdomain domain-containing protein n=1 Tax=Basilea psittacipulmonis DSM 24701 TaxID=1072685 RepID=A0A077DFC9_9BURK|nr:hypothetical protein [Basilea psittacipulmonis]AIL32841.1 hypothetical protein IX83_05495 [Basilea psittacipulmonis DSM 24701]